MKIAFKKGKWFVAFKETVLVCDIKQSEEKYLVSFETNGKRITLHIKNLDDTFKVLEGIYDRNTDVEYY